MGNLWLKIKVWTKGICFGLVLLYVLVFVIKNNRPVRFWWWYNHDDQYSLLYLVRRSPSSPGVICRILVRTTLRFTMRPGQDLRGRLVSRRMDGSIRK